SAIRHSTEFLNMLNIQYENQVILPILCLYTDRSLDHHCNYGSVQIALISLFLCGDFDLLVAVHTASHHSWTNPAERIINTLNLGLQGVALKRDSMSFESETLFEMANILDNIRKKA
ncbi:17640_t:CDS:1, partial [Racocetra persica]